MTKNYLLLTLGLFSTILFAQLPAVGINETDPQQTLHLGSANGTIRVEGLDENNNTYNNGPKKTYPLYVDNLGNLTLENETLYNSNGEDAFTDNLTTTYVYVPNGDADGVETDELYSFTITTSRQALLLVKYNISFEVFSDPIFNKITDKLSRRINTYFTLNNGTRKYSNVSKCYTGFTKSDVDGIYYNMSSSYIIIPAAGTYTITLHGEVSSGLRDNTANTGKATCVYFGRGLDTLMYKLN